VCRYVAGTKSGLPLLKEDLEIREAAQISGWNVYSGRGSLTAILGCRIYPFIDPGSGYLKAVLLGFLFGIKFPSSNSLYLDERIART
jgi:hypothetical protein